MSPVSGLIALRYLLGKKSHSAVNAIALVSLCGVAVATAAIVCVLSVFNGFRNVLADKLDSLTADVVVVPAKGKVFENCDSLLSAIANVEGVENVQATLTDQALLLADGREMPVTLKGVSPSSYRLITRLDSINLVAEGPLTAALDADRPAPATIAVGVASQLNLMPGAKPLIFTPRRVGRINPANPLASFLVDSLDIVSVFRSGQSEFDENYLYTDIDRARELLQYNPEEASAIELSIKPGATMKSVVSDLRKVVGDQGDVKDRMEQHEINFRMVNIEKWVTFLLLIFILVIASFNVISTLTMLVLEKGDSIETLRSLGLTRREIGRIFSTESWLVTLGGAFAGLLIGSILCLLQQRYGFIKLNGDADTLILSSYPVELQWPDLLLTLIPILVIGLICSLTASRFARRLSR